MNGLLPEADLVRIDISYLLLVKCLKSYLHMAVHDSNHIIPSGGISRVVHKVCDVFNGPFCCIVNYVEVCQSVLKSIVVTITRPLG